LARALLTACAMGTAIRSIASLAVLVLAGCNVVLGNETGGLGTPSTGSEGGAAGGFDATDESTSAGGAGGSGSGPTVEAGSMSDAGDAGLERPDARDASSERDGVGDASSPSVDGKSDAGSRDGDGSPTDARDAAGDTFRCADITSCATGFNCDHGACVAATVSCAAHKSAYPSSPDGVYWINPTGTPMRAYCDMQLESELCTEIEGEHRGRTRDGSNLAYTTRSILHASDGKCSLWAVRGSADGYPLRALEMLAGQKLGSCQALGFAGDVALGSCAFGDSTGYTNCGFALSTLYQWGNHCSGCVEGDGISATYVKQGPMHSSSVLSSFDGSVQSHCAIR
jgi:hypothetical protein